MSTDPPNKLTLDLADKRLWGIVLALAGVQFGAGQLGNLGVAATAEKAVEKQESIDEKLDKIRSAQDQFIGEVRYRLARIEESAGKTRDETQEQIRDLKEAVEVKREREPRR